VQRYSKGEIVMHEGDRLPATPYAPQWFLQLSTTASGKETIPYPLGKSLQLQPYWVMELPSDGDC